MCALSIPRERLLCVWSMLALLLAAVGTAGCDDDDPPVAGAADGSVAVVVPLDLVGADAPAAGAGEAPPVAPAVVADPAAGALAVAAAVPTGVVTGLVRPTITFDRPVRALGSADEGAAPAGIEPAIEGRWRWVGSATLEFVPKGAAPLATAYTVRVPGGLVALDGATLRDEYRFEFETARPLALHGEPVNAYNSFNFVRADQPFSVVFNQPVDRASLAAGLVIRGPNAAVPVTVQAVESLAAEGGGEAGAGEAGNEISADRRTRVRFVPATPLALDTAYSLVFTTALKGEAGPLLPSAEVAWAFRTYGPLRVDFAGCKSWYGTCAAGPLTFEFSTPVTVKALRAALKVEPAVELEWPTDEAAEDTRWIVSGAFAPASRYGATLTGLTDVFGQSVAEHRSELRTGDFSPSLSAFDDESLLERGLRAALPLTHVNMQGVELGFARLDPVEALPWLEQPWRKEEPAHFAWRPLSLGGARNARLRSPLDLDPLFDADAGERSGRVGLVRLRWKNGKYTENSSSVVQITGLGLHLKTSPRDVAVWAWSLADGKAVGDAEVTLVDGAGKVLATGRTAADGVARLPGIDGLDLPKKNQWGGEHYGPPFLAARVTAGDDVGLVTTRDTYSFAPYRYDLSSAWDNTPPDAEGLVFTDRGIYRPGETVYVKGVLRESSLGELRTPAGKAVQVKMYNPEGEEVASRDAVLSRFGGVSTEFSLPADGRLGTWRFEVKDPASELVWSTDARMAEYRAPAFLVEVVAGAGARHAGEPVEVVAEGRYLFGAAMSGADVSWSMSAAPGRFEPAEADGFVFGRRFSWWDDDEYVSESVVSSGVGVLDGEGRLRIGAGPAETPKNRPQTVTVEARVTDVDRQQVAGRVSLPVHPASHYVGLKGPAGFAEVKSPFSVAVVARGAGDEARVGVAGVVVKLVRHQWNTVKKKNAWGAFETISEKEEVEVARCVVDVVADAVRSCDFTAPESGYHEVVAESKDAAGRETVTTDGLWVAGPGYAAWLREDDNRVEVVADRATYDVGDTARLLVQSPFPEAEAWVTVERAGVMAEQRIRLQGTATAIEIPITEEMIPNAFVGVVLARGRVDRPGKPGDPGRPSFRVGYRELRVAKAEKRLAVTLTPDAAEKRPGDALSIGVAVVDRKGAGVEAEVAVWAVDEGVLALTGYQTPDPIEALYRPRGLSVRQSSNLTALVPQLDYGEKGRDAGGGGGEGDAMSLRQRFVTTPIFVGAVVTGADGRAKVEGKLPDNLTTFRLMAVAVTAGDKAGSGQSKVVVTKPLLARPALPRVARQGDRFAAGVVVHLRGGKATNVKVSAAVEGPIRAVGALEQVIQVAPDKGVEVRFGFEGTGVGEAKLRFMVAGGGHEDAVQVTLPVKLPVQMDAVAVYGETDASRTEALVMPGAIRPEMGGLEVTLASSALAGLTDAAEMLIEYPYGCLEQQASRLIPLVALKSMLDAHGAQWLGARDASAVVAETVAALEGLQRPDGGFGYWPGAQYGHYWGTAHAALALGEAERAGYAIGRVDLEAARRFLREGFDKPSGWSRLPPSAEERAYAVYVLARQGAPERGLEERLYAEREKMAMFGRALLAAAMASGGVAGDATAGAAGVAGAAGAAAVSESAQALMAGLMNQARVDADAVHFAEDAADTYAPLFHSDTRTTAIVLQALLAVDPEHVFVPKIARHLQTVRTGGGYRTTQEAAFSLMAMADYVRIREAAAPDFVARVKLADREVASAPFRGRSLASAEQQVPMVSLGADAGQRSLVFSAEGTGRLYYGARLRFAPQEVPTTEQDNGLVVQRWYTLDGRGSEAVRAVTEGALVRVHLRVASHQERHYVAIEDPLPAGLEAVDTTLATSGRLPEAPGDAMPEAEGDSEALDGAEGEEWEPEWYSPFAHVEMRDDRLLLFADHLAPGVHTYTYVARATTAGTFVRPPARAEEMYSPEVNGRSTGGKFWVHPRAELSQR